MTPFFFLKKSPVTSINEKQIYMDLFILWGWKIITHEPLFALTFPLGWWWRNHLYCSNGELPLLLLIFTAPTSTATLEASGRDDIHPSRRLDDFHRFSWHQPYPATISSPELVQSGLLTDTLTHKLCCKAGWQLSFPCSEVSWELTYSSAPDFRARELGVAIRAPP